eukprot:1926546-Pyramimonas_sp.AAC.1
MVREHLEKIPPALLQKQNYKTRRIPAKLDRVIRPHLARAAVHRRGGVTLRGLLRQGVPAGGPVPSQAQREPIPL